MAIEVVVNRSGLSIIFIFLGRTKRFSTRAQKRSFLPVQIGLCAGRRPDVRDLGQLAGLREDSADSPLSSLSVSLKCAEIF